MSWVSARRLQYFFNKCKTVFYNPENKPTASDVGALSINGGKLKGDLLLGDGHAKIGANEDATRLDHYSDKTDDTNRRSIAIKNGGDLKYSAFIVDLIDGANKYYMLYGQHNKPSASDVGAFGLNPTNIDGLTTSPFHLDQGHYSVKNGISTDLNWPENDSTNLNGTLLVFGDLSTPSQNKGYRVYLYYDNKGRHYYATEWYGNIPTWKSFLPLTGGTLSATLYSKDIVNHNYGLWSSANNYTMLCSMTKASALTNDATCLQLLNANYSSDLTETIRFTRNNTKWYKIYGEHNKPKGSYTGNGSATSRTINIGGIGELLCIRGNGATALVSDSGAVLFTQSGTTIAKIVGSEIKFENGILTIATTNTGLNKSGLVYNYRLL